MTSYTALRCRHCNHEFTKEMNSSDSIMDVVCPKCKEKKVEINIGKRIEQPRRMKEHKRDAVNFAQSVS